MKRWTSKYYYKLLRIFSDVAIQENAGDYRILNGKAIEALRGLHERERIMKGLFSFIGFRKKCIYYEQEPRAAGKSKWNYVKLFNLAIRGWISFSVVPLRIISYTGITISLIALIYLIKVFYHVFFSGQTDGYPSLMLVILFLGGLILLALGIIGEYLGVIYYETKKRPRYYVNEYRKVNVNRGDS